MLYCFLLPDVGKVNPFAGNLKAFFHQSSSLVLVLHFMYFRLLLMIFCHFNRTFQQANQTNAKNNGSKRKLLNIGIFGNKKTVHPKSDNEQNEQADVNEENPGVFWIFPDPFGDFILRFCRILQGRETNG